MSPFIPLSVSVYFLATVGYLLSIGFRLDRGALVSTFLIGVGFILHTAGLIEASLASGHGPYVTISERFSFAAWALYLTLLLALGLFRAKPLGAFMAPIGLAFILISLLASGPSDLPAKAFWLTLHRAISFLSFGALTLTFAASVMYLIQERALKRKSFGVFYHALPSLARLDEINRIGLILAVPFMAITIVSAAFWSASQYGIIMTRSASNVALGVGAALYAALLFGRTALRWHARRAALISAIAFAIMVGSILIHIF